MDYQDYKTIVEALYERLRADALLPQPQFTGVVSALERTALAEILGPKEITKLPDPPTSPTAVETEPRVNPEVTFQPPSMDLSCLAATPNSDYVVCIDFGTAKSKAFATRIADGDLEDGVFNGLELGLGKRDGDLDGAIYSVASSIWISNDGLMFVGSEALKLSAQSSDRERLDSIKQQLSQTNHQYSLGHYLDESINPTNVKLTHADAICFFFAYLTDLIGQELEESHHLSRYTRRRFTIPAWAEEQRKWANAELKKLIKRAQILADTFRSRWAVGIPVREVKEVIRVASQNDGKLDHLLDPAMNTSEFGISEPMAAGAGRIRIDKSTRNLVLIVDVGAGTTDFGLFLVNYDRSTAFPVEPKSAAIKMAGDHIDNLLVEYILSKATGYPDALTKDRISRDLRRSGLRRFKERLFNRGTLDLRLATDQPVTVTLDEFLKSAGVVNFAKYIEDELAAFLGRVDSSFERATDFPTLLLTGGGANIPFIQGLLGKRWKVAGRELSFKRAKDVPDGILEYDADFQREYLQLAVAMGGAMPVVDEKSSLTVFVGGTVKLGPLSRYSVTGN